MTSSDIITIISLSLSAAVSIINILYANYYQSKRETRMLYTEKRADAISDYLVTLDICIDGNTTVDYYKRCGVVYVYTSKKSWVLIDKMTDLIDSSKFDEARAFLPALCKQLSSETKVSNQK